MPPKKNSIKTYNQQKVLEFLRSSGEVSIPEIAQKVHISNPTVKKIIDFYQEKGIVLGTGKGESTEEGGKKPALFMFNKEYGCTLAVHLGPDFIFGAVTDLHGEIAHSLFHNLDFKNLDRIIEVLVDVIKDLLGRINLKKMKLVGISLALCGIVDVEKGVSIFSPHYVEWGTHIPFRDILRKKLDLQVPIHIENVNRLQAFAEFMRGKAVGKKDFVIVDAIPEGLGAGIVANGRLHEGAESLSGEIGHMVLQPDNGPDCICGGKGCFEALVSLKRLQKNLIEKRAVHPESLIYRDFSEKTVNLEGLFSAFNRDDELAVEIMNDIAKWFAIGLNNVIMVYDPEMIILQGIYLDAGIKFLELLQEKINKMSLPYLNRNVEIVFTDFGKERGVIGAAVYILWQYFENQEI